MVQPRFETFAAFYPSYLAEHTTHMCRTLHFAGTTLALACLIAFALTGNAWWLPAAFGSGYGFAWVGHFAFEKNRPATFRHPLYSFMGDWVMYWQMLTGKTPF